MSGIGIHIYVCQFQTLHSSQLIHFLFLVFRDGFASENKTNL